MADDEDFGHRRVSAGGFGRITGNRPEPGGCLRYFRVWACVAGRRSVDPPRSSSQPRGSQSRISAISNSSDKSEGQSVNGKPPLSTGRAHTPLEALKDPHWLKAFARHLWTHFREDRSFEAAGALSYTSLLALVPLMAVTLGVISAFPVFDRWADEVENYIFANFVPAAGDVIHEYITDFVSRTADLTAAGTAFLIVAAILLMSSIEKSLNRIWRVQTQRRPTNRLVIYWAVLTLGPLLVGASLALTSYLAALPVLAPEIVR
ncbi:MAG: YihY family inner membrane protein, partial [Wenzhouxiangella sp.]